MGSAHQLASTIIVAASCGSAFAHVELDSPDGGEQLPVGAVFPIEWHVAVSHDTQDWDLWYSTAGPDGPWIDIAQDLPPGDGSIGAPHSFDWTVPDDVAGAVWVRVRQDNSGMDYEDVSDGPFEIVPGDAADPDLNGDGVVDVLDLIALIGEWGPCDGLCPADLDGDGIVAVLDLVELITNWG